MARVTVEDCIKNVDSLFDLVLLASQGQLTTKRNAAYELGFYLTNWQCFTSMEEYCKVFPYEQQCKMYDD